MRRVTYGAAVSLDGYIAGPLETMDWLRWSDDAAEVSTASWAGIDTALMGRKTYEFAARSGGGQGPSAVKTYIFSRTMVEPPKGGELVREDAVAFVRELKSSAGGNIMMMGGGELGTALLGGGVIDTVELNIHPILLGAGTPLFRPIDHRVELDLMSSRPISRGCLLVKYRVSPVLESTPVSRSSRRRTGGNHFQAGPLSS